MAGRLAVIGAGLMGSGIAQVAAQAGWAVTLRDLDRAAVERPESVVGTHFFSPVPMMKLCELVRAHRTSDAALDRARAFAEEIGKTCVVVNRDVAGFVTTRLICALVVEAVRLVENGVVSPEDLDTACKLGFGHAMGPLATADLTGVDVLLHASRNIYTDTGDPKFFPPEL